MNVVYEYVNKTRQALGKVPFKYRGSKAECSVFVVDECSILFNNRNDCAYYGSPSQSCYWEHLKDGDQFSVTVLEEVPDRGKLRDREAFYLQEVDAARNEVYYNLTNNTLHGQYHVNHDAIVNRFGESYKEYAQNCSNLSKRDNNARLMGFENFGRLHEYIAKQRLSGKSYQEISTSLGRHRHFARANTRHIDDKKFIRELKVDHNEDTRLIRKYVALGASLQKAAELCGLEFPTARILLGDYHFGQNRIYFSAYQLGLTNEELQVKLMGMVLSGYTVHAASDELGLNQTTGYRYFYACLRESLRPENVKIGKRS